MNPIFQKTRRLSNGVEMPILGYGVWLTEEKQAAESVRTAIEVGYRAIDTAEVYFNEAGVGEGIRNSGIPRDQLFVTTKVHNDSQGYDNCLRAFDISMKKLGMDYADLYLIHWPMRSTYVETWRALIRLYELMEEKKISPRLIIGVPVGFVNVTASKELIMTCGAPWIVARGRKGGSNIAACICNALLYMAEGRG